MLESILVKSQKKIYGTKQINYYGQKANLTVFIRYDDECGNGHNSFSINGEIKIIGRHYRHGDCETCGCIHDDIIKAYPELKRAIDFHLCTSDGPMFYIENTMYHISDTDHNGLKKGECSMYLKKVISKDISLSGEVTLYETDTLYTNKNKNKNLEKSNQKELKALDSFVSNLLVNYEVITVNDERFISEGKEPDIKAARSCAIWPDATLKQLNSKRSLNAHLKKLMPEFKTIVESFGFTY